MYKFLLRFNTNPLNVKIYSVEELPKEQLLSKVGNELKGSAFEMKLKKLAKDLGITIAYKDKIIK